MTSLKRLFAILFSFALILVSLVATAEPVVLALGDSLTDGYGLEKSQAFPALLENSLRKSSPKIKVINAGISGSTSAGSEARLKWFLKSKPNIMILCLGANDGLRGVPVKNTKANLKATIELALKNNVKVLLAGMLLPPNFGETYRKEFSQMYAELAKEHPVTYLPFLLEGVAANPKLNLADGIHPNEDGHKVIAKTLLPKIEALLK